MGRVTADILAIVKRQLAEHGIVVWYDPEKSYRRLLPQLSSGGIDLISYQDGFFKLREELEPFLEFVDEQGNIKNGAEIPPKLIVYIPLKREETEFAFIEAETAGIVIEPDSPLPENNTKLSLAVERVFSQIAPAKAKHLARQAEEGLLTIEELDKIADETGESTAGLLQIIYGPVSVDEIIAQFAASENKDQDIIEKKAVPELTELIEREIELSDLENKELPEIRKILRRYLLVNEFLSEIGTEAIPEQMRRLPCASRLPAVDLIKQICRIWRNRIDLKDSYPNAAIDVEKEIGLEDISILNGRLLRNETFPAIEISWLKESAQKLVEGEVLAAQDIINARMDLFWAKERPNFQIEWKVLEAASRVLNKACNIIKSLKKQKPRLEELIKAYTTHTEPWMLVDRYYRLMENRYAGLELMESTEEELEKAVSIARRRYTEALQEINSAYSVAVLKAGFQSQEFGQQLTVFKDIVKPLVEKGEKVAYFLVDALRYEMAAGILENLNEDYEGNIEPRLGQLPGITTIGMAALLPGAENGLTIKEKASGIGIFVGEADVSTKQARIDWLKEKAAVGVASFSLSEVLKLTPKRKKEIGQADFIVVTSREIDLMGEQGGGEEEARLYMDDIPDKISRSIRSLVRTGVKWFLIVADHGFQMVDVLDPGMMMEGPGGSTLEIHPRVWIGRGGSEGEGFIRTKASELGLNGELEFAFPKGLGVFKVRGGAGTYFHGGLSPQEHIIPVLSVKAKGKTADSRSVLGVRISMNKNKITNRIFTVTLELTGTGLFPEEEKRVRVEVISGKEEIGKAVAAGYDYDEKRNEIVVRQGQPNVVTIMLQRTTVPARLTLQVVDVDRQIVLDSIKDVPVELTI